MNINRVVLVGNLTADPELRSLPSGSFICKLRLATNTRVKRGDEWTDKPNYFDITVFGKQGESCARVLHKGSQVGVDGRLDWRSWEAQDGSKRSAVEIIADTVMFMGSKSDSGGGFQKREASDVPSDFPSAPSNAPKNDMDEIPF
jgi:single-strand DNA-binding protein